MNQGRRKLLAIGVDAADLGFIRRHGARLAAFSAFLGGAECAPLAAAPLAGAVWPSFTSGAGPGAHGIYHHIQWDPAQMRLRRVNSKWLDFKPFWRQLGRSGVKVVTVDAPFVFSESVPNVLEVANWGSHDTVGPFFASDPKIAAMIRRRFGRHPMGLEIPVDKTPAELQRIRAALIEGAKQKGDLICALMASENWDFFIGVFGEVHRGGHILYPDDADGSFSDLEDVYAAVDEAFARILAGVDRSTTDVLLFSLHGMGPNQSQAHFLIEAAARIDAAARGLDSRSEGAPAANFGAMRMLRNSIPAGLQNAVARGVPGAVRDFVVAREMTGGVEFASVGVFALLSDLAGYVRLNIKGRESPGALMPGAEAERVAEFAADAFKSLRAADGTPLVSRVSFPTRAEAGDRAAYLPDLLVEWRDDLPPQRKISSELLGVIEARRTTGRGGNHRFEGFYALAGEGRSSPGTRPRRITELAPFMRSLVQ